MALPRLPLLAAPLLGLAIIAMPPPPAAAATIYVDGNCSLGDAVRSANSDNAGASDCEDGSGADVIELTADVTITAADAALSGSTFLSGGTAGLPDIGSEITIRAAGGTTIRRDPTLDPTPFPCTLASSSPFRIFNVLNGATLTLEGVTVTRGCIAPAAPQTGAGGAVLVIGTLVVDGGGFVANRVRGGDGTGANSGSSARGGAIATSTSFAVVEISGALFDSNNARGGDSEATGGTGSGGALYASFASSLTVADSTFVDNQATGGDCPGCTPGIGDGGALLLAETTGTVTGTTFTTNTARGGQGINGQGLGGAVSLYTGDGVTLERLILDGNQARGGAGDGGSGGPGNGGAMYVNGGSPALRNSLLRNNLALGGGGASAGVGRGGAVTWWALGELTAATFLDNTAQGGAATGASSGGDAWGGALALDDDAVLVGNLTFVGNQAIGGASASGAGGDGQGGALLANATAAVSHLTLSANDAVGGVGAPAGQGYGGGLYVLADTLTVDNTLVAGNHSTPGGGSAAPEDCYLGGGTLTSAGFNFVEVPDASCTFGAGGDVTGTDPQLVAADDFGCREPLPDGTCLPVAPLRADSPAVDGGSCVASGFLADARSSQRAGDVGGVGDSVDDCDPGAFELLPGGFHTLSPCRIVDTRVVGQGPELVSDTPRTIGVVGVCDVPDLATAVSLNATVTEPTDVGNLKLFPDLATVPGTSNLNFAVGVTRANNALVPLASDGAGTVAAQVWVNNTGTAHLILDVNGWFE